jgi:chitinase
MPRSKGLLITYDTPQIAIQKAQYIAQNNLGGGMWWELDADKPRGQGSLVEAVRAQWGDLEWRENELDYPGSSQLPSFGGEG